MLKPPTIESRSQVEELTKALDTMTIARPAAVQVLTIVDDPNATVPRLASAIELDPALTAQIMRLANSAFYGMSGRVGNASFAVTVIGFSAVRSLAAVNATGLDNPGVAKPARFWEHAAACAAGCAAVAPIFGITNGDAFAAGLLHDLGIALLHRYDPAAHDALVSKWGTDGVALRDAEAATLGLGHDEAAARVLRAWNFPDAMVDAIALHHRPLEGAEPFTRLVVAGDGLAELVEFHRAAVLAARESRPLDDVDDIACDDAPDAADSPAWSVATDPACGSAVELLLAAGIPENQIEALVANTSMKAAEILASLPTD